MKDIQWKYFRWLGLWSVVYQLNISANMACDQWFGNGLCFMTWFTMQSHTPFLPHMSVINLFSTAKIIEITLSITHYIVVSSIIRLRKYVLKTNWSKRRKRICWKLGFPFCHFMWTEWCSQGIQLSFTLILFARKQISIYQY